MKEVKEYLVDKLKSEKKPGTFTVVASDESVDRVGDVLKIDGWVLDDFKRNPQMFWNHNKDRPIGTWTKIWKSNKQLKATGELDLDVPIEGYPTDTPHPTIIHHWIKKGIVRTNSVTFRPLERPIYPKNSGDPVVWPKNLLLEISPVSIPANANAEIIAKELDITEDQAKAFGFVKEEVETEEKGIGSEGEELDIETVEKPFPNEHACRINEPGKYDKFRRVKDDRKHDGKPYDVIYAQRKDNDKWEEQAYRYDKEVWTADSAKTHCKDHDGSFEAASKETSLTKEEIEEIVEKKLKSYLEELNQELEESDHYYPTLFEEKEEEEEDKDLIIIKEEETIKIV